HGSALVARCEVCRAELPEYSLVVAFFFQAEDGIRDPLVTGVQTCALPILCCSLPFDDFLQRSGLTGKLQHIVITKEGRIAGVQRSEERRVGKECRSRWAPRPGKTKAKATVDRGISTNDGTIDRSEGRDAPA